MFGHCTLGFHVGVSKEHIIIESLFNYLAKYKVNMARGMYSNRDRNTLRCVSRGMKRLVHERSADKYKEHSQKRIKPIVFSIYRIDRQLFSELPDNWWTRKWRAREGRCMASVFRYCTPNGDCGSFSRTPVCQKLWHYMTEHFDNESRSGLAAVICTCKNELYLNQIVDSFKQAEHSAKAWCMGGYLVRRRIFMYNSHTRAAAEYQVHLRTFIWHLVLVNIDLTRCVQSCCVPGCTAHTSFNKSHTSDTHGWAANRVCREHLCHRLLVPTFGSIVRPLTAVLSRIGGKCVRGQSGCGELGANAFQTQRLI